MTTNINIVDLIQTAQTQGFAGSQGVIGFTGSQGVIGFTGSTGTGINVVGVVATNQDLPTDYLGTIGDSYVVQATGFLWLWEGTSWLEVGQFTGFTGSQGFTGGIGFTGSQGFGFTGSRGNTGFTGSEGFTGSIGYTGSIGFTGSQGAGFTGSQGVTGFVGSRGLPGVFAAVGFTGSAGTSVKIVGSVSTSSALPLPYGGAVSDGYITQDTGNLWMWTGSAWINLGLIRGPQGFTGSGGSGGTVGDDDWGLITGSLTSSDDFGSIT